MNFCKLYLVLIASLFSSSLSASLIDRGGGLIYDTILDVTWLQDANHVETTGHDDVLYGSDSYGQITLNDAQDWARNLRYYDSVRNIVWEDWRLPKMLPVNPGGYDLTWAYDGKSDRGFNIVSPNSELSHLFYVTLGNLGAGSLDGIRPQPGWGLRNTGPFNSIELSYWSGTLMGDGPDYGYFSIFNGEQLTSDSATSDFKYAWAVRDGDVGSAVDPVSSIPTMPAPVLTLLILSLTFVANRRFACRTIEYTA